MTLTYVFETTGFVLVGMNPYGTQRFVVQADSPQAAWTAVRKLTQLALRVVREL